jgi:hypothetical protein
MACEINLKSEINYKYENVQGIYILIEKQLSKLKTF